MNNGSKSVTNTIANLAGRLWTVFSVYLFIPFYIKFLGEDAYGVVSLFSTLQASFSLLCIGFSGTLRREFSSEIEEDKKKNYLLLKSTELIYVFIVIIIVATTYFLSQYLTVQWLNIGQLSVKSVSFSIILMGISIAIQLTCSLWNGCILGLNKQVLSNAFSIGWSILRGVLSIVAAYLFHSLVVFFVSYIIADVVYAFVLRVCLHKCIYHKEYKWTIKDMKLLKSIWKYAAGVLVISIISLVSNQLDKIVISKCMDISAVGAYNTIISLGSLTRLFNSAVTITYFNKFVNSYKARTEDCFKTDYKRLFCLANTFTMSLAAFVAVFSSNIIMLWLNNTYYVELTKQAAPILILSIAIMSMQEIPYTVLLARGNTKTNAIIGAVTVPIFCGISIYMINKYQIMGAAISFAFVFVLQTIVYYYFVNRKLNMNKDSIIFALQGLVVCGSGVAFATLIKLLTRNLSSNLLIVAIAVVSGGIYLIIMLQLFCKKEFKYGLNLFKSKIFKKGD